jgi:hypothetical protein
VVVVDDFGVARRSGSACKKCEESTSIIAKELKSITVIMQSMILRHSAIKLQVTHAKLGADWDC